MPRPLRIEYENAYYHVMNRGRGRQRIFHDKNYFEAFLKTLEEAHQRFGIEILCYCLMSNHYHLLVKTPEANLGRAMRHINGLYTQRYNRLKQTDGSLFRGRYKAILVEEDSYQLQLSRYIHRNPIDAKMVTLLADYQWSSYPFYIGNIQPSKWLFQKEIYGQLGSRTHQKEKYRAYVEQGVDEDIKRFYGKRNIMPYMGSAEFRERMYKRKATQDPSISRVMANHFRPSIDEIIQRVSQVFKVSVESIRVSRRGRVPDNIPRWVAMYLSQECSGALLTEIASGFGLKRAGSVPTTIKKLRVLMDEDARLAGKIMKIRRQYDT